MWKLSYWALSAVTDIAAMMRYRGLTIKLAFVPDVQKARLYFYHEDRLIWILETSSSVDLAEEINKQEKLC